jgi:hypothetical protein
VGEAEEAARSRAAALSSLEAELERRAAELAGLEARLQQQLHDMESRHAQLTGDTHAAQVKALFRAGMRDELYVVVED